MTKTNKQVVEFVRQASNYLRAHPEENKFKWALARVIKRGTDLIEKYQEALEDLRVEHCAIDAKQVILRDERGNYQFTREGLQNFNVAARKITEQEVEIEPYIAAELPKDFDEVSKEEFLGYVIAE